MALLHISLQDGFENDTVVIQVNGNELFRKSGVSTRLQIGLADRVETTVPDGPVAVTIRLPERGIVETTEQQVVGALYLGVSLTQEGRLVYRSSSEPFGYL